MAYVPDYEYDIFVSYAQVDNKCLPGIEKGWVTTLVESLKNELPKKLGRAEGLSLWIDYELPRNVQITDEILSTLKNCATLLVILSPGYLASPWCQREKGVFLNAVQERRRAGSRVFLIELDDIGMEDRPSEFQDTLKYQFWMKDHKTRSPRILGYPKPNYPDDQPYYERLSDLAYEIADELKRLRKLPDMDTSAHQSTENRPCILLAEVTDDLDSQRNEVKRYLDQAGINVLPDSYYPIKPNDFAQALNDDLGRCELFVQLLSRITGKKTDELPKGYAGLQYECALKYGKPILQWRSPELDLAEIKDNEHQTFLQGDKVLAIKMEEFKSEVVRQTFFTPPPPQEKTIQTLVFVNMETSDRPLAKTVCDMLDQSGVEYALRLSIGKPSEIREDLKRLLLECDGLIIIYGSTTASWVREQLLYCRKVIQERERPLKAIAVYEGPPEPKDPLDFKLKNMHILNCRMSPDKSLLQSFIKNLHQGGNS